MNKTEEIDKLITRLKSKDADPDLDMDLIAFAGVNNPSDMVGFELVENTPLGSINHTLAFVREHFPDAYINITGVLEEGSLWSASLSENTLDGISTYGEARSPERAIMMAFLQMKLAQNRE